MADGMIGGGNSSDNLISNLLSASRANENQQAADAAKDDAASDHLQAQIIKKLQAKQAQVKQVEIRASLDTRDEKVKQREEDAGGGKYGPAMQAWVDNKPLQAKLTDKAKEMFLASAERDPQSAGRAAEAMGRLANSNPALLSPAISREAFSDVHSAVVAKPQVEASLTEALGSKLMQDGGGDRMTKQNFLRFAGQQGATRGAQVKLGGDMLGTLSGADVPNFAQRAAMDMLQRSPDNTEGMHNLDAFVQQSDVRMLPKMARGYATGTLAKGDGETKLKEGLTDVARNPNFRTLAREDKARVFSTIGQGRATELRAMTDQTLMALRSNKFPVQGDQVSRFLGHLGRQFARATQGQGGAQSSRAEAAAGPEGGLVAAAKGSSVGQQKLTRISALEGSDGRPDSVDQDQRFAANEQDLAQADSHGAADGTQGASHRSTKTAVGNNEPAASAPSGPDVAEQKVDGGDKDKQKIFSIQGHAVAAGPSTQAHAAFVTETSSLTQAGRGARSGPAVGVKLDLDGALRAAKRGSMPGQPKLMKAEGLDEDDARRARSHNRAAVMRYYTQLNDHYNELDGKLKKAKYRQEVAIGVLVKQADGIDLSGLEVRADNRQRYESKLLELKSGLDQRQVSRSEYVGQLKQLQAQAYADGGLNDDERTWVHAQTLQGQAAQVYLDLAGKKNRKLREVGNTIMPQSELRRRAADRRTPGKQARYFRPRSEGAARGMRSLPVPGGSRSGQPRQSGHTAAQAKQSGAYAAVSPSSGAVGRVSVQAMLSRLDANLSPQERLQQATEMMATEIQKQAIVMATQMMQGLWSEQGIPGPRDAAVTATQPKQATLRAERTVQGKKSSWGIPRSYERDLGAGHNVIPVRAALSRDGHSSAGQELGELPAERDKHVQVVKTSTPVRDLDLLYSSTWSDLSRPERALMQNLGWTGVLWGSKNAPTAPWPMAYKTPHAKLSPAQRASVQALGLSIDDWNDSVERLTVQDEGDAS